MMTAVVEAMEVDVMIIAEEEVIDEMTASEAMVAETAMTTYLAGVIDTLVMIAMVAVVLMIVVVEVGIRIGTTEVIVVLAVMRHQLPPMVNQLLVEKVENHMEVEAMMMIGFPVENINC